MAYGPACEELSDALSRVMAATGQSTYEAQTDLCQAIADGAIKFQAKLQRDEVGRTSTARLNSKEFQIRTRLKPKDFDWERSRPLKSWLIPHGRYSGYWHLKWIELFKEDVTNVLCSAGKQRESVPPAVSRKATTSKSRPSFERAQRVVNELYPHGVPGQAAEPNARLCRRVADELKKQGLPAVSDDTILRAAGRRK